MPPESGGLTQMAAPAKRRPSFNPAQGDLFALPRMPSEPGPILAGLHDVVASAVSQALRGENRFEVAAAMSELLNREVSKWMLDKWCSEASEDHNIPAACLLALIGETRRYDVLDALVQKIGAKLLVGEEVRTAQLGDARARMRDLKKSLRELERAAPVITRGDRR